MEFVDYGLVVVSLNGDSPAIISKLAAESVWYDTEDILRGCYPA